MPGTTIEKPGDRGDHMILTCDPEKVLAELIEARQAFPYLAGVIDLELALLSAGSRLKVIVNDRTLTAAMALARVQADQPLLQRGEFTLDCEVAAAFRRTVCAIVGQHRPELAAELAVLAEAGTWPCNGKTQPAGNAESWLVEYLERQTLRPFLTAHARSMQPLLAALEPRGWRCPICGGHADMAALTRPDGRRILLCSACDTQWPCQRIGCPFCGNEDAGSWAYYLSEDSVYRLYVCDACQGYLKTVDQREQATPLLLAVERVLTAGMDVAAVDAGYSAPP